MNTTKRFVRAKNDHEFIFIELFDGWCGYIDSCTWQSPNHDLIFELHRYILIDFDINNFHCLSNVLFDTKSEQYQTFVPKKMICNCWLCFLFVKFVISVPYNYRMFVMILIFVFILLTSASKCLIMWLALRIHCPICLYLLLRIPQLFINIMNETTMNVTQQFLYQYHQFKCSLWLRVWAKFLKFWFLTKY